MRTLLPLVALLALLAGCGGGEDTSAGGAPSAIGMKNLEFVPGQATGKVGQAVTWRNDEAIRHNVVATSGADFRSPIFGEGETFRYTPKAAGTIQYVCTLHPGMTGTLQVTA